MSIKQWRHLVEICAFVAAGLWACYVFVYEERIKPLSQPIRITMTSSADVKDGGEYQFVTFRMTLRNPGSTTTDIAAEELTAAGLVIAKPGTHRNTKPPIWDVQPQYSLARGPLLLSSGELREGSVHGVPGRHIFLRTDESAQLQQTVVVRRHQFAAVEFDYVIIPGKAPIDPKIPLTVGHHADGSFDILDGPQNSGSLIVPL